MQRSVLFLLFTLSLAPALANAASGWINDSFYVPVRAEAGSGYRIVHRGLKSGTQVEILSWPKGAEWAQIRAGSTTGWVETQYLSRQPTAQLQLDKAIADKEAAQKKYADIKDEFKAVSNERDEYKQRAAQLEAMLKEKTSEFSRLEEIAQDPIRLEKANQELNKELSLMRTALQKAEAENSLLKNDQTFHGWLLGLATIVGGMVIGWFFKSRSDRKTSSWV